MGLLHIYDDDDWRMSIMTKRDDAAATVPVSGGIAGFVANMDAVVQSGHRFNRVLFETHGGPGLIGFGGEGIDARWMRSWSDRGWAGICNAGCRLYFNGCNVAEGDAGWDFLHAAGEVFLLWNGGMAFGHTSSGFADPFTGHVVHLWGDTRHVYMPANGAPAYG